VSEIGRHWHGGHSFYLRVDRGFASSASVTIVAVDMLERHIREVGGYVEYIAPKEWPTYNSDTDEQREYNRMFKNFMKGKQQW